ncbi:MAG: choice-of-anchor D domain-containing protein, partial [Candidatus Kapabacteria bacterium]|nr:choice-of-anchor D domain-containing protein [Candidatus Kapabacteria bacterium]
SLNNGATWNIIVNKATMFRHIWKNVPVVNNAKLLIRAVQRSDGSGNGLSPEAEWTRTYGGSGFDNINAVRATQDGGYILAGFSHSSDLDTLITPNGVRDVWLVKIDRNGTVEWQRTLGGSRSDGARDVRQTRDGGYIIAGYTESGDGNVTDRFGLQDMWIVKTDAKGVIEWQRSYGGLYDDDASAVQEVPGGGYVFAGFTRSNNAYVSGNKGLTDAWIVRTDDKGGLLWQRTLGGSNHDYARGISVTADGMYLVSGYSESDNGDVAQNKGDSDAWSVVLSSGGDAIVWQKSVGGSIYDGYNAVTLSSKDIVAAAGSTLSSNGDITTNKGSGDGLFVRMNLDGSEARITNYGGSNSDVFNAVAQTRNGDYVMAGSTSSSDGDIPSNRGLSDFWILRADSNGVVEWSRAMGGSKLDDARAVIETPDGGLLIAGSTASSDGDVGFNRGDGDAWVVKLGGSSSGVLQDDTLSIPVTIVVPTSTSVPVIDLKKCVVGSAKDSLVQQSLRNTSSYPVRIDSMRITGADQNQFRILSAMPPFTIASGATRSMEYRFRPLATGVRTATLEIFTQTDTLRQTLTGEGIASVFQLQTTFVDFGRIANGTRRDTTIPAFQNTSTQPMRVSSMYVGGLQSANFSVIAGNAPVIIQPQAFHTIGIRCTGIDSGIVFARLFFVFDGTDSPQSIPLAVDVFNRVVLPVRDTVASTISLSQVEAPAGTRVNIHLVNSEQRNMQIANAPKKFEAKVRVNPTVVLTDVTPYPCISIDATTCELTIGGERSTSDTLASFGAIATLGTTDNSVLEIASFRWFTTDSMIVTDTRLRNGSVKITDVCDAGGVRLFIPTGAKQSLSIRPNPASTAALIEYGLAESTVATLEIINSMGQVVASPVFQRQLRAGIYQNTLDVNTIPSGTYIVRLSTPNSILTTRMDVVR